MSNERTIKIDDPIREEGSIVSTPEKLKYNRERYQRLKAEKKAMALATGKKTPNDNTFAANKGGRPKSIVNRVTEYGALFNQMNEERIAKGLSPLKTAMETMIEALQADHLDIKDRVRIAEKVAAFESSRAPTISIEHVQSVMKDEDVVSPEDALDDFMESLRKV